MLALTKSETLASSTAYFVNRKPLLARADDVCLAVPSFGLPLSVIWLSAFQVLSPPLCLLMN